MSVGVGRIFESVFLSVCLFVNSISQKRTIQKCSNLVHREWPWDILQFTWFWVQRSKVNVGLGLTAIRRRFELFECLLVHVCARSVRAVTVSSVPMHNVQHPQQKKIQRSSTSSNRSMSMEDYDKPLRARTMSVESASSSTGSNPPASTVGVAMPAQQP